MPKEQLFDKKDNPDMIHNLADYSESSAIKLELQEKLEMYLQETDNPRAKGKSPRDTYNLDK